MAHAPRIGLCEERTEGCVLCLVKVNECVEREGGFEGDV